MPPHIEPNSLKEMATRTMASLIFRACNKIQEQCGNYDEEKCRVKLDNLDLFNFHYLFDEVFEVVLKTFFHGDDYFNDIKIDKIDSRIFLSVIMCDKMRKLSVSSDVHDRHSNILQDYNFWVDHIAKMDNIEDLDICQVTTTDSILEQIGRSCRNLKKICLTSDLDRAKVESLVHIFKCRELRQVKIIFHNWSHRKDIINCIRIFVKRLPKLQFFDFDEMGIVLSNIASTTSLQKVIHNFINVNSITDIIRTCPNLTDLQIGGMYNYSPTENAKILAALAQSSLRIETLVLIRFSFGNEMTHMLSLKGAYLRTLTLVVNPGTLTVNEVYTIGMNCPYLENLEINEFYRRIDSPKKRDPENCETQLLNAKHPLFIHLRRLSLESGSSKWDQRILPLILRRADKLTSLTLANVFAHNIDVISEILKANSLTNLESLKLVAVCYGRETSTPTCLSRQLIDKLIAGCPKLNRLELFCVFEEDVLLYRDEIERKVKNENLDLTISFYHTLDYNPGNSFL